MSHSRYSPSTSARWLACPGSIQLSEAIDNRLPGEEGEDGEQSAAAAEGSEAHALAAAFLNSGGSPVLTSAMDYGIKQYLDHVRSLQCDLEWIEERVDLMMPTIWPVYGTPDFVGYKCDTRTLHVVDFKYGRVAVSVDTPQLMVYAVGAAQRLGKLVYVADEIVLHIVQPRAGGVTSKTISLHELLQFATQIKRAVRDAELPDAPLVAGDHCRYCPAAAQCPALKSQALTIAQQDFMDTPAVFSAPPPPEQLPNEVLGDLLEKMPILESWIGAMKAHAQQELEQGRDVPGFTLAPSRTHRTWTSEKEAEEALRDRGYSDLQIMDQPRLMSVAAVEKIVGSANLPAEFVVKPVKLRLVRASLKQITSGEQYD